MLMYTKQCAKCRITMLCICNCNQEFFYTTALRTTIQGRSKPETQRRSRTGFQAADTDEGVHFVGQCRQALSKKWSECRETMTWMQRNFDAGLWRFESVGQLYSEQPIWGQLLMSSSCLEYYQIGRQFPVSTRILSHCVLYWLPVQLPLEETHSWTDRVRSPTNN